MTTQTTEFRVPESYLTVANSLPADWQQANLVGRVMLPEGPAVVYIRDNGDVVDITTSYPLTSDLFEVENPAQAAKAASETGTVIGKIADILKNSSGRDAKKGPYLLSPADYQEIEAAGVTFVESMIERMVEQAAMAEIKVADGQQMDTAKLDEVRTRIREEVAAIVGTSDFSKIIPGSEGALKILAVIKEKGMSTIYPQVGLAEKGELFSKASVGLSVGSGAQSGYSSDGQWTNPEPEVVLFVSSQGRTVGAAHGNDVNDRHTEGLSALYLHDAKVRNGSTVIGPFVRLFDETFTINAVKQTEVGLKVEASDGTIRFQGANNMAKISRSPERIVAQAMGAAHYRPTGVAVFCGTMTVPLKDEKGDAFTHKPGDIVTIGSPQLGYITNVMMEAEKVKGLENGPLALSRNLAGRGLLIGKPPVAVNLSAADVKAPELERAV